MKIPVLVLLLTLAACSTAWSQFVHPGVAHTSDSIAFAKEKVTAKEEPWLSAWNRLNSSRYASLQWQPKAFALVERGPYNDPDVGSSEFSADGRAAYCQAICWVISGKEDHAKKAAEILDAWSGTLESIENHDAALLVGMSGYNYVVAAELLKHTWKKWPVKKQKQFESTLRNIFYPTIKDFYPTANGNWDASMMQVMIAMAVFLDDQKMFDKVAAYYREGQGNGAIGNYFKPSGQCQESGRDQAHTQMGLDFLASTCETAWIQGVDLYGDLDNRLLKGFEYTAKYNLGFDVPYEAYESVEGRYHYRKISDDSRGRLRPMYERIHNHYANRKEIETPFTQKAAMKLRLNDTSQPANKRTSNRNHRRRYSAALDTLMFAGVPVVTDSPDVQQNRKPADKRDPANKRD